MARHSDWTDRPRIFRNDLPAQVDSGATRTIVVDRADVTLAPHASKAGESDSTIARFSSEVRLLPTFARTYTSHEAVAVGAPGGELGRIMRSLEGKFVVANRARSAALPSFFRDAIGELQALFRRSADAHRIAVTLSEPEAVVIRHAAQAGAATDDSSPPVFFALVPYTVTVAVRGNSPASSESLIADARALSESLVPDEVDWFNVGLCIPDRDALEQMTGETALFYRGITGRLGAGTPERYWHLDAWEQYTEPGRTHGFIVPEFLRLPQYSPEPAPHDETPADIGSSYGSSLWPRLTRRLAKRALIPPGFCFVEFWARVSLRVGEIEVD